MKKIIFSLLILCAFSGLAQIKGVVVDEKGNPLSSVSVFVENTYTGTTTNEQGQFTLKLKNTGTYTIAFQYLGFKTKKINYTIPTDALSVNVQLVEENYIIKEVVVDKKQDPANGIIRNAIASKKDNTEHTSKYEANFYSRGIFKIKDAPKKIIGQKFDIFDEVLDSTRSGILYLSETVSKISFQKPDKLKETIIASKVSGNDNGFSFNNAAAANFDFYENYIPLQVNVVSPIADNAFNYYKYKLESSFFTDDNLEINKIKVTPRRVSEPVMEGYLYIVDGSWAVYAVDLTIKGTQIQSPALTTLTLKQSFNYNLSNKIWVKNSQTLDIVAGIFGIKISGRFTYVYSDYIFKSEFAKKTFTKEVLSFEDNANKKDSLFWNTIRPIPLTNEETIDYLKKNLLQTKKKSKKYLDSVDAKRNKFKIFDILTGYTHTNSYLMTKSSYEGIIKGVNFNTVQGWAFESGLQFMKSDEEKRTYSFLKTNFNYGIAESKLRVDACYINKFSNINQGEINLSAGSRVAQFDGDNPISNLVNTVSTLFFKENYIKLYERNYANIYFKREVTNGLVMDAAIDYSERKPLFNNTDYVTIKDDKSYTSNNPLLPFDYVTPAIMKHNLVKAVVNAKINFGQKYWSRPDGKYNLNDNKFPVIQLGFEKGFAGTDKKYEFNLINAKIIYEITLGNKGNLEMRFKAGKFYNAANISFVDFYHPNGNQTHVGQTPSYLNVFNLLPYYTDSTNDSYFEVHAEHNDKGYIMNKIPLLSKLKTTLVIGYHNFSVPGRSPYHEFSIGLDNLGFGKFRVFRFDYLRSYRSGFQGDGIIFGLKFLNILSGD